MLMVNMWKPKFKSVTVPLPITLNKMKLLDINLIKHAPDLCNDIYKVLMKEIKEDLNAWRGNRRLSTVKLSVFPKLSYRCNTVPIKI